MTKKPIKPGAIKKLPNGDVIIGAPTAVAVVVLPKDGE